MRFCKSLKAGTTVRSSYDYTIVNGGLNSLGQRMGVRSTFNLGGGHTTNPGDTSWAYDSLGQVTSAAAPGTAADRAYEYDTIGNRIEARDGVTAVTGSANYAANALNQYTMAAGVALPTTPAPAPYDMDGNLRFDGGVNKDNQLRQYIWDAENRLIEVLDVSGQQPVSLVTYAYDALSRRIARIVGTGNIFTTTATLYLHDSWNCIAEYQASLFIQPPALTRTRTWGLDLSGSLQGAGGVGGLLSESHISNPQSPIYYPTYDGNGNVSEYLAADGSTAAHFEYDPFGNTVVNTDTNNQFAYRFSTKPLDPVTGWFYYAYRYYDPMTGRWPSRYPIEEEGGFNLYGFVGNDGIGKADKLGAMPVSEPDYNYNPSVFRLPINEPAKGGGVKVGEAISDFGIAIRNQDTEAKCCIEAYIYYKSGPYGWVNDDAASKRGLSVAEVELHESAHILSMTNRIKSVVDSLKQEKECYESESAADEAIKNLGPSYDSLWGMHNLAEEGHNQAGGFGTPGATSYH